MSDRVGWVRVKADDLSEFHRELIKAIPKYASVAVSEMMLPETRDALEYEERLLLRELRVRTLPDFDGTPAFQQALANKLARRAPVVHKLPWQPVQDWSSPQLTLSGEKGQGGQAVPWQPQCLFRAERINIDDSLGGRGTVVRYFMVGCRVQQQLPFTHLTAGMRTDEAREHIKSCKLDTCSPGLALYAVVDFLEDCEFRLQYFGKAVR